MKPLNKLDNYLLENHPLIWMTKIHYVLPTAAILNLIAFVWGYFIINERSVLDYIGDAPVDKSNIIFFILIISILFIILWSLAYFKKSAVRRFYPVSKFYFTKLLALLFVNFCSVAFVFLSYTIGYRTRIHQYANQNDLRKELLDVNVAMALLPGASIADPDNGEYTFHSYFEYLNPDIEMVEDKFWDDRVTDYELGYNPFLHPENNVVLPDSTIYQFMRIGIESSDCNGNETYYTEYISVPQDYFKVGKSLRNYYGSAVDFDPADYGVTNTAVRKELLRVSKSKNEMKKLLEHFEQFLKDHQIRYALNAEVIAEYYSATKGERVVPMIDDGYSGWDYSFPLDVNKREYSQFLNRCKESAKRADLETVMNVSERANTGVFYLEQDELEHLFSNATSSVFDKDVCMITWILAIVALTFSFFFLIFSFAELIRLLITVPIVGALIVVTVFCCFAMSMGTGSDAWVLLIPVLLATFIIMLYTSALNSKSNKVVVQILGYISAFISPFYFIGLTAFIGSINYTVYTECGSTRKEYPWFLEWIEDPGFILILSATGILLFTLSIKRLIAKPD